MAENIESTKKVESLTTLNKNTETPRVEEGKVIAERLNGYAAFVGCLALIGSYLTTGQIIPGFV